MNRNGFWVKRVDYDDPSKDVVFFIVNGWEDYRWDKENKKWIRLDTNLGVGFDVDLDDVTKEEALKVAGVEDFGELPKEV